MPALAARSPRPASCRRARAGSIGSRSQRRLHDVARHAAPAAVRARHCRARSPRRPRSAARRVRRVGHEQRVRPVLPGQLRAVEMACSRAARGTRAAPAPTRSCRPVAQRGSRSRAMRRRAARLVHHRPHALAHRRAASFSVDRQLRPVRRGSRRAAARRRWSRVRCGCTAAPGGDARDIGRKLQRRHLDVALADAADDRVTHVPGMAVGVGATRASGSGPPRWPGKSRSSFVPRPSRLDIAAMRSMPVRRATS